MVIQTDPTSGNTQYEGRLYIVASPIGNLGDFSARAQDVLRRVDAILCEDTRISCRLLRHFGIRDKKLIAYHGHNERQCSKKIISELQEGRSFALLSSAGTPVISDPGLILIRECHAHSITVSPIPGPCAAITALCASGVVAQPFCFYGFLPARQEDRRRLLRHILDENKTSVLYESPHRLMVSVDDVIGVFGEQKDLIVAKELTKVHERILTGSAASLKVCLENDVHLRRGEFVMVLPAATRRREPIGTEGKKLMRLLALEVGASRAARIVARCCNAERQEVYDWYQSVARSRLEDPY